MLLAKNLNTIKVLIFTTLCDSYINHDKVVSENNMLRGHNEMERRIKKS